MDYKLSYQWVFANLLKVFKYKDSDTYYQILLLSVRGKFVLLQASLLVLDKFLNAL